MGVFYALSVLTALEIGVIYMPNGRLAIGIMLVGADKPPHQVS